MHVVIINGSPRIEKFSNTEKILDAFTKGLVEAGASFERYAISNKNIWEKAKKAYIDNTEIILAMPLYVENVPGILLEFLETLPVKDKDTRISFIIQGGFAEASQLECGRKFLEKPPKYLNVSYGGSLIKGDNFGIRVVDDKDLHILTDPYIKMGKAFVDEDGFTEDTVERFAGPDYFPFTTRVMLSIMFKTIAKKKYTDVARSWGCTKPIDHRPWEE